MLSSDLEDSDHFETLNYLRNPPVLLFGVKVHPLYNARYLS
jgi:hypothetical protein